MDREKVFQGLKSFIVREMLEGEDTGLDGSTPLLKLGLINSMSIVMLARFIKDEFGVDVPNEEMTGPNLQTLDAMTDLVLRLA